MYKSLVAAPQARSILNVPSQTLATSPSTYLTIRAAFPRPILRYWAKSDCDTWSLVSWSIWRYHWSSNFTKSSPVHTWEWCGSQSQCITHLVTSGNKIFEFVDNVVGLVGCEGPPTGLWLLFDPDGANAGGVKPAISALGLPCPIIAACICQGAMDLGGKNNPLRRALASCAVVVSPGQVKHYRQSGKG